MAEYNANKQYTWTPDDTFEFSGEQFGKILNAFRSILSAPEAQKILRVNSAHSEMEKILAKKVEEGVVKEMEEETQQ